MHGRGEQPVKARRKTGARKVQIPQVSTPGLQEQVAALTQELKESLERQTATSEVLKVISSSPSELKLVFEAILENATRICEAKFGNLFLYADNSFRIAAQKNARPPMRSDGGSDRLLWLATIPTTRSTVSPQVRAISICPT
jgi:hypothetical protein